VSDDDNDKTKAYGPGVLERHRRGTEPGVGVPVREVQGFAFAAIDMGYPRKELLRVPTGVTADELRAAGYLDVAAKLDGSVITDEEKRGIAIGRAQEREQVRFLLEEVIHRLDISEQVLATKLVREVLAKVRAR
jgi:hypothetical protein